MIGASRVHDPTPLRFPTCNNYCSDTFITFIFGYNNLNGRITTAPSLRIILLEVTLGVTNKILEL
jgi:hypothetical protein